MLSDRQPVFDRRSGSHTARTQHFHEKGSEMPEKATGTSASSESAVPQVASIVSPNGAIRATVRVAEYNGERGCLLYDIAYRGQPIIADSQIGFTIRHAPPIQANLHIVGLQESSHDSVWQPVYGERSEIPDRYNQLVVELEETTELHRRFDITFRAYDEGVAFCYTIRSLHRSPDQWHIERENTRFRFLADHTCWTTYHAQGGYERVHLSEVRPGCERPLTIAMEGGPYVALAEARLVDYARMKLARDPHTPYTLISELSSDVVGPLPLTTPWRVVMLADTPGQLLEHNYLILNLNDPCAISDTSFIRPGKVIREVTLTTQGGKACVDFAVRHHLQYVEFDAGWYGHEYDDASDATTVTVDPKRSPGPLDLPEVIRYAAKRGIGILLYVNRRALEKQLDQILPLYQTWGVKGVKYGFVNVGSQYWTTWLHAAIRKAADYRLMVDVHDEYRPTGYTRTYPNLMTQEGIRGDEEKQPTENTLTVLFTRMLAGAGDQTNCYYDPRVDEYWSHAYQLAKAVCIYSPWQFLYWYDRPPASPIHGGAGGNVAVIGDEPELEFFDHLPTVWDDTRVIHGAVGEYATIARRHGKEWFIGTMNNRVPRNLDIPLDFLEPGVQYIAHIYTNDPAVPTRTHVRIDRLSVDATTVLTANLGPNGGQAVRITPA